MQNNDNNENATPEGFKLRFYKEETEEVSIKIPRETYRVIQKIAKDRSLPVKAVIRMYISHGMRLDMAENYPELAKELFEKRFRNRKKHQEEIKGEAEDIDLAA